MRRRLRLVILAALIYVSGQVHSQGLFLENQEDYSISQRSFTSIQNRWYDAVPDSSSSLFLDSSGFGFWSKPDSGQVGFGILPIIQLEGGYSTKADAIYETTGGFAISASKGKFKLNADFIGGVLAQPEYLNVFTDSLGVLPSTRQKPFLERF